MSQVPQPPRVGDYIANEMGRVVYAALDAFAVGGMRVKQVWVPLRHWHDWNAPEPGRAWIVEINGSSISLIVAAPDCHQAVTFIFEPAP